jgi:hypothetical protein
VRASITAVTNHRVPNYRLWLKEIGDWILDGTGWDDEGSGTVVLTGLNPEDLRYLGDLLESEEWTEDALLEFLTESRDRGQGVLFYNIESPPGD